MKFFAVEEHISRPEYMSLRFTEPRGRKKDFPLSPEAKEQVMPKLMDDGEKRLDEMDRLGIERAILLSGTNGFDFIDDVNRAKKIVAEHNDYLLGIAAKHPDRYQVFVSLPMIDGEMAAEELERCMKIPGCAGANITGYLRPDCYIDDELFTPLWEAAEKTGAVLTIHPTETGNESMAMYRDHICLNGSAWSWGVDTATYVLRIITGGIFDRYPNVRLLVGHMGEMLPYVLERLDTRLGISPMDSKCRLKPSEYFKKNIWISTSGSADVAALKCAINVLGADRILFAIDYPFESMEKFVRFLSEADISEDDKNRIAWENAAKIFLK